MEYQLYHCANFPQELNYSMSLSNIRMYQSNRFYSNNTLQNITTVPGWSNGASGWVVAGSGAGNHAAADFSCVCWESGRIITQWLMAEYPTKPKPYIGLIESDVGGTSVFYWAAGIAGRACNLTGGLPSTGEAAGPNAAGALYNAMINPLCMNGKGISIRQAIYYQVFNNYDSVELFITHNYNKKKKGEADSGENDDFSQNAYSCTLNGMIYSWRYCFNQTNLPFINVQLPNGKVFPYNNDDTCQHGNYGGMEFSWAGIEVAQYKTYAMNDNTGLVTCEDQGQNTLHYSYKLEVSERVALWMRYLTFNDMTMSRYHAISGIDPRKKGRNNRLMASDDQPVPPKFVKAYRKASDTDPFTVYIEIENTGPNGMKLQPAVNCSAFDSKYGYVTICDYNCTIYYCCELGGANTLKFRMDGWYWYTHNGGGNNLGLMNWMPGNVTSIETNGVNNNSVIVARPILPPIGNINWPQGGDSVTKYEAIAVRQVELGTSNACVWGNSYGIPISKGGPYDIDIQD